jgi:hypothetical protein
MKYYKKRRYSSIHKPLGNPAFSDDDPLAGVANLFDVGLVFIVGLIVTLFSAYSMQDLFDENKNMTIMKQSDNGEMEIITKKGQQIKAVKVSKSKMEGQGTRLGVAYQLQDGSMVYVPEK